MKRPARAKERTLRALERFSTAMLSALGYLPAAGLVLAAGLRRFFGGHDIKCHIQDKFCCF